MRKRPTQRDRTHKALAEFCLWFDVGLDPSIHNVLELKKANPPGITNPVLRFAVPRAMNYVVERFALEVVQAWELVNEELRRNQMRTMGVTNRDFRHLKRIRNKLIAHKVENFLRSQRHENWYKKTYGSYESVLALIRRVAEKVDAKIRLLQAKGLIPPLAVSSRRVDKFGAGEIDALLAALKAKGVY